MNETDSPTESVLLAYAYVYSACLYSSPVKHHCRAVLWGVVTECGRGIGMGVWSPNGGVASGRGCGCGVLHLPPPLPCPSQAKKAREQAALRNAQSLFEELDAEKERQESKKKAAAKKRSKRKERKRKEQAEKMEAVVSSNWIQWGGGGGECLSILFILRLDCLLFCPVSLS